MQCSVFAHMHALQQYSLIQALLNSQNKSGYGTGMVDDN